MSRKIIWEHWNDPFLPVIKESERLKKESENSYQDSYEDYEGDDTPQTHQRTPIAMTNWGYFPITDVNRPGNIMNFWLGHTNFNLDKNMLAAIEMIKGVEALEIQTRYRFRIGIAKLFSSVKTKKRIEYALCTLPRLVNMGIPPEKIKEINEIHKSLKKTNKYWTMLILPNASVETFAVENEEEVLEKYQLFKETATSTNGIVTKYKNGNRII